jgi:chorismate lyase/3-hydroxybenzoate synthase
VNRSKRGAAGPSPQVFRPQRSAVSNIFAPPLASAPAWVIEWAGAAARSMSPTSRIRTSPRFTLLTVRMPDAGKAEGRVLEQMTEEAYRTVLQTLGEGPHPHMVRIWNFIPEILQSGGANLDRYMRFNSGRHRAYMSIFGGEENFERSVPAASGVGHRGDELVIHALGAAAPGLPIANPRQRSPHHYSRRFGPLPPCFARATLLEPMEGTRFLLIGGTASIRGEESMHADDLESQLSETRENLIALLGAASNEPPTPELLDRLDQLRVYYPNTDDLPTIRRSVEGWFTKPDRIEWRQADLCRAELLVEIEGRAVLPAS